MTIDINDLNFAKVGGLIPAIVQDDKTEQVLMLGYMNQDAIEKTQNTGLVTFYSRTRKTLWTKGETSGNSLNLVSMEADCDKDTILVRANPIGPTCHLLNPSCFGSEGAEGLGFLGHLFKVIESRKDESTENSYTAKLLNGPLVKAAQKVGEEGVETALAAVAESDEAFLEETADLFYHSLVLLAAKNKTLDDVIAVLRARHT